MKIEHVALYVNNLEKCKDFFLKYFNGKSNNGYHNKTTNFRSYFITFEDGTRLELMNKPEMIDDEKNLTRTGFVHIAFSVGSKENVDTLTERLSNDGFKVISGPRTTVLLSLNLCFCHVKFIFIFNIFYWSWIWKII